ncbi:TPA: restriction endonuclease, partial [Neisseria gonorrhoeae]
MFVNLLKINLKIQNMNLFFDTQLGKQQNKATHKIRVMSEAWL